MGRPEEVDLQHNRSSRFDSGPALQQPQGCNNPFNLGFGGRVFLFTRGGSGSQRRGSILQSAGTVGIKKENARVGKMAGKGAVL